MEWPYGMRYKYELNNKLIAERYKKEEQFTYSMLKSIGCANEIAKISEK